MSSPDITFERGLPASGTCQCGCGGETLIETRTSASRGTVRGVPRKFINGHCTRLSGVDYLVEDRGYKTPCWIWQLSKDKDGYGFITNPNRIARTRAARAHVVYYERRFGPIPAGLVPDHLCRIKACVNPEHLEAVTVAENTRRGMSAKLSLLEVVTIKQRLSNGDNQYTLAGEYGVTQSMISRIRRGVAWRDVQ